jgi:gluconate 2-dehydrogenase gamma chain
MTTRREHLVAISAVAAHALFGDVADAFARATRGADDWHPEIVPAAQGPLVAEVVETILPATDTPGAKAARVHLFVDLALARCVPAAGRAAVLAALTTLGGAFLVAAPDARGAQLAQIDPAALGLLQELTILGYFTSEIGATQALAYDPVPGGYRGCVPLAPGQKGWAT